MARHEATVPPHYSGTSVVVVDDNHIAGGLLVGEIRVVSDDTGHGLRVCAVAQQPADHRADLARNPQLQRRAGSSRQLPNLGGALARPLNGGSEIRIESQFGHHGP